jgi:hypothetical protein
MDLKKYFELGPVFGYFFRKKDPSRPKNFNIKVMHGVNKISILMFLACVLVILYRVLFR